MISKESFVLICTICTVHLKKVHERWRKQQTMSSKSRKDAEGGQNASNNIFSITHALLFLGKNLSFSDNFLELRRNVIVH